ncbi:TlyA family RNA methyltransferase [Candidatus Saccharibacteria bacterium]|nr:MAG: TlyA family RNA methyltransferase [Candidatus Saccharibacteria bacterium]
MKQRLDVALTRRALVASRSQAESYIRLGKVLVNGRPGLKSGQLVSEADKIEVKTSVQYVSRAALKLESADSTFHVDWRGKTVLDVGSSTGGFTQYALQHGAKKVFAVDVGTEQLHPSLRSDERIELHEKTDIRNFMTKEKIDIVVGDVSFISLREILPHVSKLITHDSVLLAMVKPQFEAGQSSVKHKGVIKNDRMRRDILHDFETWARGYFIILDKKDSEVAGSKGNIERFYLLRKLPSE